MKFSAFIYQLLFIYYVNREELKNLRERIFRGEHACDSLLEKNKRGLTPICGSDKSGRSLKHDTTMMGIDYLKPRTIWYLDTAL